MAKKIFAQKNTNLEVIVTCKHCNEDYSIDMTYTQYKRLHMYQNGQGRAKYLLSDIPANVRKMIITGICPDCMKNDYQEGGRIRCLRVK